MIYSYAQTRTALPTDLRHAVMDPTCFGNHYPELHLAAAATVTHALTLCGRSYQHSVNAVYKPEPNDAVCEFCTLIAWPRGLP